MAARLQAILSQLGGKTSHAVVADSILATMLAVGLSGIATTAADVKAGKFGVTKDSARLLLETLASVIHSVHDKAGPAFREAYTRALAGAEMIEGFAKEHPVFCLVVALGVLYILTPYAVQLLGFMPDGPALGKRA